MIAAALETASPTPYDPEAHTIERGFATEELARLRFAILLTARWEASDAEDPERRKELRVELADLRRLYYDKIDEIAMTFGVAQAIKAKAEVERGVVVPPEPRPTEPARVDDGLYF